MIKTSFLLFAAVALQAATPVYITDIIRSPVNSRPYKGTIYITVASALTCGDQSFIKDVAAIKVGGDGAVSLTLMPNDACAPAGSSYQVRYQPPLGPITTETWVVPTSDVALTVSQVRAALPTVSTAVPIALTALASGGASMDQALCWSGTAWGPGDCGGGAGTWGSITGTLSTQADLMTALNAKQASINSTVDVTARDVTVRSITVGDGSTAGKVDACTADESACATVLAPLAAGSEPTCDATLRGAQLFVLGGAGVSDAVKICVKTAADTYAWKAYSLL